MTIAGVPGIAIRNNRFISWGLTNLMNDDNDFLLLNRDSADTKKYFFEGKSYPLDSLKEIIYVKDSAESEFKIYLTKAGPVISNLAIRGFADFKQKKSNLYSNNLLTFLWTGFELSDEISSFYNINTAKNWDEFKNGLKEFNVPAMNFMYADIYGNIGYQAAGKIPVRKTDDMKNYLYPNSAELTWQGFVEFENLPHLYNPKEGYIVTANTNPFDWMNIPVSQRYYISYLWEMSSRYTKIKEYLDSRAVFDTEDFRLLQNSFESPYARGVSKFIPAAYKDQNITDENIKWCIERFSAWNGEMNAAESIGLVYNTFLIFLLKNTYGDEMGEQVLHDFFSIQNMPYRSIQIILKDSASVWFDNINTSNTELRDDIIRNSLIEAIEFLKTQFDNQDINTWHWGGLHKVKFKHPFGFIEAMDKAFNIGPFSIGGDQTTTNNTEYQFNNFIEKKDFSTVVGASMRSIIDMSDPSKSYTVNTTGQNGQPVHENYKDQSRMWLYGEYKTNTMNELEMLQNKYRLLTLLPY
jgi:penicillin amidase